MEIFLVKKISRIQKNVLYRKTSGRAGNGWQGYWDGRAPAHGSLRFFQGGGAGGPPIRVGDVAQDPPYGQGPGQFSTQSRQADYGEAAGATGGQDMGVPTSGDSGEGGVI